MRFGLYIVTIILAGDLTIKANPFKEGDYNVYQDGKRTGTIEKNPFVEGEYDVKGLDGSSEGTLKQNPFSGDWNFEGGSGD